jgi:hypothetical protein
VIAGWRMELREVMPTESDRLIQTADKVELTRVKWDRVELDQVELESD